MRKDRIKLSPEGAKWSCTALIKSYSHVIEKNAFDNWNEKLDSTKFVRIGDRDLEMRLGMPSLENQHELYPRAVFFAYSMLMALNVGTLGHFWWHPVLWPMRFTRVQELETGAKVSFKAEMVSDRQWGEEPLRDQDVANMIPLVRALPDLDTAYPDLYSVGMTLLSIPNLEQQFYREVFGNFYRIIERLTAVDVLQVRNLTNEKKQVKKAMKKLGMDQNIVEEFDELYVVRCRDTMHAQGSERRVTFEEAVKCKVICDYMLTNYLRERAVKRIHKRMK